MTEPFTTKWDGTPFTPSEQAKVDQLLAELDGVEPRIADLQAKRFAIKTEQSKALDGFKEQLQALKAETDLLSIRRREARLTLDEIYNNDPNRVDSQLPIR